MREVDRPHLAVTTTTTDPPGDERAGSDIEAES